VFGRGAVERPPGGGYPIEGCDDFSSINVQKSAELSDLIAARLLAAFSRRLGDAVGYAVDAR